MNVKVHRTMELILRRAVRANPEDSDYLNALHSMWDLMMFNTKVGLWDLTYDQMRDIYHLIELAENLDGSKPELLADWVDTFPKRVLRILIPPKK